MMKTLSCKGLLGNSVTVAQLTLDQLVKVRILVPQLHFFMTSERNTPALIIDLIF